ncbi:MAG: hemolysin family protein [Polyangiales bacterium]
MVLVLILANGFFAGAEIAVVALRKTRIEQLAANGGRNARAVLALQSNPERFLATVQVGITVVGSTAAAFGGESIAHRIAPELQKVPWIGERAGGVSLTLVVAAISYLSIVLGELVPKSLALRAAERYALLVGQPLLALAWLARPLVWFLGASANVILKPFGDQTTFTETRHSAEELQDLVEEAAKAGTIDPEAGEIASRALELPELTAADVMVPRQAVVGISRGATADDLKQIALAKQHSRLPVYETKLDEVTGYVNIKDLLALACDQKPLSLDGIMRHAFFVPESKRAVELLREMRQAHLPLAIVVDEQGGTSGIVTMEDLLEELVGEIFNEQAREVPQLITREPNGAAVVSGLVPVREVNRELGLQLPEDGDFSTIAGLCLSVSGRIPKTGEHLQVNEHITLEVVDASPRRVRSVRVIPQAPRAE